MAMAARWDRPVLIARTVPGHRTISAGIWFMLFPLFCLVLISAGACGTVTDQVRRRFKNLYEHKEHGLMQVLRWKLTTRRKGVLPFSPPIVDAPSTVPGKTQDSVTWIGHNTFLVNAAGKRFLLDPIFSEYCAPIPFQRMRRRATPGLDLKNLANVDGVFITHNHYDHLDRGTIERLPAETPFIVPAGLRSWFSALGRKDVQELEWWNSTEFAGLQVTCVPAQHFSSRTLWDRDRTLWAGWILKAGLKTIYLAGDTGYCPVFKEIGERFGPMDLAVIPIGAYEPRWFMEPMHVNPEEALQIHLDVRSRLSVASHWGTFCLTDEPMDEPPKRLRKALSAARLGEEQFRALRIGETIDY